MKLRLPSTLRTALLAVASLAMPLAVTVATGAMALMAQAQATDLTLDSANPSTTVSNTVSYDNVTVAGGTSAANIGFSNDNKDLSIGLLDIGSELTIQSAHCDYTNIERLTGSGNLVLARGQNDSNWGNSVVLGSAALATDEYTGTISLTNHADATGNSNILYVVSESVAKGATINLGKYTTFAVAADTVTIAALTGTDSTAAVISKADENTTKKSYETDASRNTSDSTTRTLVIDCSEGSDYNYSGTVGSATNPASLNLVKKGNAYGNQYLKGKSYLNNVTVSGGGLVLSDAVIAGNATVADNSSMMQVLGATIAGNLSVTGGNFQVTGNVTLLGSTTLTDGGRITVNTGTLTAGKINNNDGKFVINRYDTDPVINRLVTTGKSVTYVGDTDASYQMTLEELVTNIDNVVYENGSSFTSSSNFSDVVFGDGSTLVIGNGQTLSTAPHLGSDTAAITLEVKDSTSATYKTQITGVGVSQVKVGAGATLSVEQPTDHVGRYCLFNREDNATLTVSLADGATLNSSVSLFGWDHNDRESTVHPTDINSGTRTLNMGTGSTWNIVYSTESPRYKDDGTLITESEYLNRTTIVMSGATINIRQYTNLWFERYNNFIETADDATKMSVITGEGSLQFGNNSDNGAVFDIARSSKFEIDSTNTADLQVSVLCTNNSKKLYKRGAGVLELTNAGNDFNQGVDVEAGTLKLGGEGGKAGSDTGTINVLQNATLELAHSADCTTSNAIALNGNLVVSGSGVETISGALTGTAQSLTVGKDGGLVLDGQTLRVANYAATGSVVLTNYAVLQIDAVSASNGVYSPVSGSSSTSRLIINLGEYSDASEYKCISLAAGTNLYNVTLSGTLALSDASATSKTNLQGNALRMADGSKLLIHANTNDGGNGNIGSINLAGAATISVDSSVSATLSNAINDRVAGATNTNLIKDGSGKLTLTGRVLLDKITVNAGTLNLSRDAQDYKNEISTIDVTGGMLWLSDEDQLGAVNLSGTGTLKLSTHGKLTGDLHISGGSAKIAIDNAGGSYIEGTVVGETTDAVLNFVNGEAGGTGQWLNVTNLRGVAAVNVADSGALTASGTATNTGETFTKSGNGTLAVQSISSGESGAAGNVKVEAGTLKLTGETTLAAGSTVTLGSAATMTATGSGASLQGVSLSSGGIDRTDAESLGEMTGLSLEFTAAVGSISNVTLRNVSITSSNSVKYGNVKAVAAAASEPMAQTMGIFMGNGVDETLTATSIGSTVQTGGTATGTLTLDVDSAVLGTGALTWTIFSGVTLANTESDKFTLSLGDTLGALVAAGERTVTLSGGLVSGSSLALTTGNLDKLTTFGDGALLAAGNGDLKLTISAIPEPATATLSLLALAALAARRRRSL